MNDALRIATDGLLTTSELAARPDFTLGLAVISPSSRSVAGPGGAADVEPRVMQVLVVLAEAAGQVVTRATLFDRCWGGVFVGDDSLNRAIGAVRKLALDVAGGSFEIETIPRTGYRLTGATIGSVGADSGSKASGGTRLTRRAAIGGVAAAALASAGIWLSRSKSDERFDALMTQADEQMRKESADEKTIDLYRQAIAIQPDSAKAWGSMALLKSFLAPGRDESTAARLIDECERDSQRALSLDPKQPDALLAMFELQGSTLDWITRDRKLREIVASDPKHFWALSELGALTAATGLVRESWGWNERSLALEPLSSDFLGKRALKLWVFGRTSQADKVSDQGRALYPSDRWQWWVRVQIYAFTGRARAAFGMLDGEPFTRGLSPMAKLLRASLPALDDPSAVNIRTAREACIRTGKANGAPANEAILIMSALRELDTAFDIANFTLLSRGPLVTQAQPGARQAAEDAGWRVNTQWMWTPPVAAMRADPRFLPLCDGIGLTDYWRKRGLRPDYQAFA